MSAYFTRFAFAATAFCALAWPASAQTIARKDLSVDAAVIIATTAMADCKAKGWPVSATVVGRNGEVLVQLRGDGTGPHTMENSFRKAFTSRTFRIAVGRDGKAPEGQSADGRAVLTGFTTGAARCRSRSATTWSARPAPPARRAARRTRPASRPASTRSRIS